ncbi:hypothetical protein OE88DRAFT_1666724 [Heliocybe sulcata]|uniref:Uncharacterized protein n=1 Tax=Heliocybe sulcata TaxID=5364 RepID=A0A5C3MT28_9AGAM|nr:hypothetical protein OE88DRAFT_1666724 [Heliocybe sulcata]
MNVFYDGSWIKQWQDARAAGRFSRVDMDSDEFRKLEEIHRLYRADKAFEQDCIGLWPKLPRHRNIQVYENWLKELYCHLRYHIGLFTYKPDAARWLDKRKNPKPPKAPEDPEQLDRLQLFIWDPRTSIALFLSSIWFDNGWQNKRDWCRDAPLLISFYVDFLLRVGFHAEEAGIQELESARALLDSARTELPQTLVIARALRCSVSRGLKELWADQHGASSAQPTAQSSVPQNWAELAFDDAAWFKPDPGAMPLISLLGPTTLPLTHTLGLVETSTRRIVSILPPKSSTSGRNNGVDEELAHHLGQVILAPWGLPPDDCSHIMPPTTSMRHGSHGPTCHNPNRGAITVLVEPPVLNALIVGMGLSATFAQIIPHASEESERDHYWFVEDVHQVIPSYYIDEPAPPSPELL